MQWFIWHAHKTPDPDSMNKLCTWRSRDRRFQVDQNGPCPCIVGHIRCFTAIVVMNNKQQTYFSCQHYCLQQQLTCQPDLHYMYSKRVTYSQTYGVLDGHFYFVDSRNYHLHFICEVLAFRRSDRRYWWEGAPILTRARDFPAFYARLLCCRGGRRSRRRLWKVAFLPRADTRLRRWRLLQQYRIYWCARVGILVWYHTELH